MQGREQAFSLKSLFVPLTTLKAIHIIVIVGFIVYFNSLFGSFIGDDFGQIVDNGLVHSPQGILGGFTGGSFNAGGQLLGIYYKPLLTASYTFLYVIFGPAPFFFHLFQLSFHIASSILLFVILRKFFRTAIAFFIALIFLVHPINVEAVVYIADLQDVLFTFFGLISLYLLMTLKNVQRGYWFVYLSLFCSLLSKETGILFLVITSLYLIYFKSASLGRHIIILCLLIAGYLFLRIGIAQIQFRESAITPIVNASLQTRLMNIPEITTYYLNNFAYPDILLSNQSWVIRSINVNNFYMPLGEIILFFTFLVLCGFWIKKKNKDLLKIYIFFVSWFALGVLAHIQLLPLDVTASDRYFYFPIIGLLGILATLLSSINLRPVHWRLVALLLFAIIISLSLRTIVRNADWKSGLTLMSHDIKYARNDYLLESTYGSELMAAGQDDKAFYHITKAISIYPSNWIVWNNLGVLYYKKGEITKAKDAYQQSIKYGNYYGAYENLAFLLLKHEDSKRAKDFIEKARLRYPGSIRLLTALFIVQYKTGDHNSAMQSVKQLYVQTQSPEFYDIYSKLQQNLPVDVSLE